MQLICGKQSGFPNYFYIFIYYSMRSGIPLKYEIVYKKNTSQSCITYSYKYAHPIKYMFMII